jgi:hypothetical protein
MATVPDLFYSVTVPPGQTLVLAVSSTQDMTLSLFQPGASCATPTSCLGREVTSLVHSNVTNASENLLIAVEPYSGAAATYQLFAALQTPGVILGSETCSGPIMLPFPPLNSSVIRTGNTTGAFNDVDSTTTSCPFLKGPDQVYAVTVPAGKTLTVKAAPATMWDISVAIMNPLSCSATASVCLSPDGDSNESGRSETVNYANSTAVDQTINIVIDSFFTSGTLSSGPFRIYLSNP